MQTMKTLAAAALIAAGTLSANLALAQQDGITRTELQRHDLSAKGREVIQVRVDIESFRTWANNELDKLRDMARGTE